MRIAREMDRGLCGDVGVRRADKKEERGEKKEERGEKRAQNILTCELGDV